MTDLRHKLDMILEDSECTDNLVTSTGADAPDTHGKKNTDISKYFLMICIILCIVFLLYRLKSAKPNDMNIRSKQTLSAEHIEREEFELEKDERDPFEKNNDVFFQEF